MRREKHSFAGRFIRIFLVSAGALFLLLVILAFTTLPFHAFYRLAIRGSEMTEEPAYIVMLSGAGIPSENGLIRAYYTGWLANECPDATVIIAAPGDLSDSASDPHLIERELRVRGMGTNAVMFETEGKNTRGQAQNIALLSASADHHKPLAVVTSPEHIRRAVLSFRKAGFTSVSGFPAFETALGTSLVFNDKDLKGNRFVPPIGENLQLRYQFWNHLKYEIIVIREYMALAYYKLRGWI